jgi:hypothetical protein
MQTWRRSCTSLDYFSVLRFGPKTRRNQYQHACPVREPLFNLFLSKFVSRIDVTTV